MSLAGSSVASELAVRGGADPHSQRAAAGSLIGLLCLLVAAAATRGRSRERCSHNHNPEPHRRQAYAPRDRVSSAPGGAVQASSGRL